MENYTKEKDRIRSREYKKRNKEKVRLYNQKYREKNREKILELKREYHKKIKGTPELLEKRRNDQKKYREKNREQRIKYLRGWNQRNREKLIAMGKIYRKEQVQLENERRKKLGLPIVGQRFRREMEMFVYINHLFPDEEIRIHDRKTLNGLEIDAFLPGLKLGFEYMGRQHFEEVYITSIFFMTREEFEAQKFRDERKIELCKEKGITLIHINYDEKLSEQLIISKLNGRNVQCIQSSLCNSE